MNIANINLNILYENKLYRDSANNVINSGDILLNVFEDCCKKTDNRYKISYTKDSNPLQYIYLVEYFYNIECKKLILYKSIGGYWIEHNLNEFRRTIGRYYLIKIKKEDLKNIILYRLEDNEVYTENFIDTIYYKKLMKKLRGIEYRCNWVKKYNQFPYLFINKDNSTYVVYEQYVKPTLDSKHKEYFFKFYRDEPIKPLY